MAMQFVPKAASASSSEVLDIVPLFVDKFNINSKLPKKDFKLNLGTITDDDKFQQILFSVIYTLLYTNSNLERILEKGISLLALVNITTHGTYSQHCEEGPKSNMSCLKLVTHDRITKFNYAAVGCKNYYSKSNDKDNFYERLARTAFFFFSSR